MNRVTEIKQLHEKIIGSMRTSVADAIRIGELLTAEKAEGKHGDWQDWVAKNMPFSIRTARNYMRLYKDRMMPNPKTATVAGLTNCYRRLFSAPQKRPQKRGKGKADKPPKGRQIKLQLTEPEAKEYHRLLRSLMGKVFHTTGTKSTILAALRYAHEHKDDIDAKKYTSNNGTTRPVDSGSKGKVFGRKPLLKVVQPSAN